MAYTVIIKNNHIKFEVEPSESVLDAALRQQINLPYGCKSGACGSCKAKIISGKFEYNSRITATSKTQVKRIYNEELLCCVNPTSDLEIKICKLDIIGTIPLRKFYCRVSEIIKVSKDTMIVFLQLPSNEYFQFSAGQYLEFLLEGGKRRAYSIANFPKSDNLLELHIQHLHGGIFTDHVFSSMKLHDILRFEGPLGSFFLRENTDKPIVFLCSRTGFAPIKSIIEYMLLKNIQRPVRLYWGGKQKEDLYLIKIAQQWNAKHSHINFIPVLSKPSPSDVWEGRTGLVHQAVIEDLQNLSGYEVYACGSRLFVQTALHELSTYGNLPKDAFFSDAFINAADLINTV